MPFFSMSACAHLPPEQTCGVLVKEPMSPAMSPTALVQGLRKSEQAEVPPVEIPVLAVTTNSVTSSDSPKKRKKQVQGTVTLWGLLDRCVGDMVAEEEEEEDTNEQQQQQQQQLFSIILLCSPCVDLDKTTHKDW